MISTVVVWSTGHRLDEISELTLNHTDGRQSSSSAVQMRVAWPVTPMRAGRGWQRWCKGGQRGWNQWASAV